MSTEIDENLYSRQLYAIGFDAMKKMISSNILISGMTGLGVEIAKNVILQGCKKVTLHDTRFVNADDLSTNYYVNHNDIGKNRADAIVQHLAELNSNVFVEICKDSLSANIVKRHDIIVLVDHNLQDQIKINNFTHQNKIHFISCATIGLLGQIFCDFGENFVVYDPDGEQSKTSLIEHISNDINPLVKCYDTYPHNMTSGDFVKFSGIKGMEELNSIQSIEIEYVDKISFRLKYNTSSFGKYLSGGEIIQVKPYKILNFKPLQQSLTEPKYNATYDIDRSNMLHALFMGNISTDNMTIFYESIENNITVNNLSTNYKNTNNVPIKLIDQFRELIGQFFSTRHGKLVPMNSIIGGMVALEVLKACSGKYTPIQQWFYFDAFECLPHDRDNILCNNMNSRYDGQIRVFGRHMQKKLADMKYFIVGSGAIGCELLKNFAMIGLGTGPNGQIYITDMDTIEKSNLNRQFLFRNNDIGKAKSEIASKIIKKINPDINIIAYTNRVGLETEHVYDVNFFESLDGVANALDNIQTRLYVDKRCLLFKKSLLESGTMGTKASVQVIVPHLTESYGSMNEQQTETSIPICTIKSFPNTIEHTIQWAREQFEDLFSQKPKHMLDFINKPNILHELQTNEQIEFAKNIYFVSNNIPKNFDECIATAYEHWHKIYNIQIQHLLEKHPIDSLTSEGVLFWSGTKKCPRVLNFDINNGHHIGYVHAFANIWANIFGLNKKESAYTIHYIKILESKSNNFNMEEENEKFYLDEINRIKIKELKKNITPQIFEKDDDTNYHIDFITYASNMRAINYDISIADRHTTKGIVGKIIPALASVTSVVAGLVTLELYKLAHGYKKIELYKNSFINLALPYFGSSEPGPTSIIKIGDREMTIWDSFIVKGDITLKKFMSLFQNEHKLEIDTIIYDNFMLYGPLLTQEVTTKRFKKNIKEIIEQELEIELKTESISLQIGVVTDDMEILEVLYFI